MKTISNNLWIALFLALISQGIQAQFDDIYYDPDKDSKVDMERFERQGKGDDANYTYRDSNKEAYDENGYYDDEYGEWEDQDYYYTSRIKRFHRPVYGFGYYDPFYTYNYYYDPYDFDPWYYDRDIYSSSWRFSFYTGPVRWTNYYSYRPFWSYWDACSGWNDFSYGYYNYNPWYWGGSSYYYGRPSYYHHHHYYNNGDHTADNGHYYGSRRFGSTNTSKRGPVRFSNPSPRVITETKGEQFKPDRREESPRRIIRSADGDAPKERISPRNNYNNNQPDRNSYPENELLDDKKKSEKTEWTGGRNKDRKFENEMNPGDRYKEEQKYDSERGRFRPHRMERPLPLEKRSDPNIFERESRPGRNRTTQPELNIPKHKEKTDYSDLGGLLLDAVGGSTKSKSKSSDSGKSGKSEGSRKSPR